jgi:AbrB family looped-hinge helix DNA binding protein
MQYLTAHARDGMISYTNHTCEVIKMNGPEGKYAWTATVGEKGQIVIPKQAREIFNIKPGDTLLLLGDEQRGIAIPPKGAFADLFAAAFDEKGGD